MYWFVLESPLRASLEKEGTSYLIDQAILNVGWGNGYVVLPPGHIYHGKHYDDIDHDTPVELTFAASAEHLDWKEIENHKDGWVIGWDTAHYGDSIEKWPKEEVERMTLELAKEMIREMFFLLE